MLLLSLGSENGNSLDFELTAFIDHSEPIEGIVISAVDRLDDLFIIYQHDHFAVTSPAPLDGMGVAVRQGYFLISHLDDRRPTGGKTMQGQGWFSAGFVGQPIP